MSEQGSGEQFDAIRVLINALGALVTAAVVAIVIATIVTAA
jgi:hypothetical protein